MKNPDFLPPWGCPWHGLIKNGQLHLPGDKTLAWPQPPNGDTHLIDFGVPAVETSEDHAEQGKQWLNKAIIAGGYLHGVELPAGSWIWRDSNGENWLVEHDLLEKNASASTATFTMRRFGVIGGKAESYPYTVNIPDLSGQATQLFTLYFTVRSVHPMGGRCIIGVGRDRAVPLFWLELEISGAANEAGFSLAIIKDAETAKGVEHPPLPATAEDAGTLFWRGYKVGDSQYTYSPDYDASQCVGTVLWEREWDEYDDPNAVAGAEEVAQYILSGSHITGYTNKVIGMMYDSAGSLAVVTHSLEVKLSASSGAPSITKNSGFWMLSELRGSSGACASVELEAQYAQLQHSQSAASEVTLSSTVSINGSPVLAHSDGMSFSVSGSHASDDGEGIYMGTLSIVAQRGDISDTETSSGPTLNPNTGLTAYSAARAIVDYDVNGWPYLKTLLTDDGTESVSMREAVYSNTAYGVVVTRGGDTMHVAGVATPGGMAASAEVVATGQVYASYNPITCAAERDTTPVSWT